MLHHPPGHAECRAHLRGTLSWETLSEKVLVVIRVSLLNSRFLYNAVARRANMILEHIKQGNIAQE